MRVCCEHNPCPDIYGPKLFKGRFQQRPWRCPKCGKLWHTVPTYSWADFDGWEWKLSIDPAQVVKDWSAHE